MRMSDFDGAGWSQSEQIFFNAFTHAAIGMALIAPDGKWLRANKSTCQLLGYGEDELIKLTFQDITYPDDLDVDLAYVGHLLRGEIDSFQMEKRYFHKAGHVVWGLLSVSLVRDENGTPRFFISQIENITERKLAEEALRISEDRLERVIRGTGVGLWDWQVATGEMVLNDRWAEMLGYTLEELSPININTWDPIAHPDDLRRAAELLEEHFAGKSEYYEAEVRLRHKDGHWVWVLDRGKVVEWDGAGKPVRVAGTHLDITERKRVEAEREQMIAELQGALDEVNTLQGILPICSYCKQIRNDENYWQAVETYISEHTDAEFSHSICPTCYEAYVKPQLITLKKGASEK